MQKVLCVTALNSFFLNISGALVKVKQSRERMGTLEAVAGGFILSALLSVFLFFFVHGWAVLFFFAFLAACLAYSPKPKPGVSVVMVATPYRKIYAAKAQNSNSVKPLLIEPYFGDPLQRYFFEKMWFTAPFNSFSWWKLSSAVCSFTRFRNCM